MAVEAGAGAVVAHGGARVSVGCGFLDVAERDPGAEGGCYERVPQGVRADLLGDPGARANVSMSARRTENKARDRARHQPVNWRRSSVYASRVSPRYPASYPASASRSALVNTGWTGTRELETFAAAIRHLQGQPGPGRLGLRRSQR